MTILQEDYMPILKWRQGEYQALYKISEKIKNRIVPLLVIPPVEYDFEERRMKKTVQEHIETFPRRYSQKWGKRHALIDIHESLESEVMNSGKLVSIYIFDELRKLSSKAIPVVGLNRGKPYTNGIKSIISVDASGVGLRIKLEDLMTTTINSSITTLLKFLQTTHQETDLIIDLGLPESFEPYPIFTRALFHALQKLQNLNNFRSLVIAGTSLKMNEISAPGNLTIRHEWLVYKNLIATCRENNQRICTFGDYAIESPEFLSLDMRLIKPAGKIVYTAGDNWYVTKGTAFRGNESQMIDQCKRVIASGYYMGPKYSHGDQRITDTATKKDNTGNLSTWKQVGMNHHMTMVVNQLSMFHGS